MTLQMQMIRATEKDIPRIQQLAEEIWWKHYPEVIGEKQVKYMLSKLYNSEALFEQIKEKRHVFYLLKTSEAIVGFLSIADSNESELFINKFYILQTEQGKNLGTSVYQHLLKLYPRKKEIRLTVNRQNYKSINFYFKLGFKIESVADFDIGDGYVMNDFVMLHRL
jgi:diamine N-acetyltransferase